MTFDENPPRATASARTDPPNELKQRDWWVNWAITEDGRKQPRAPYDRGDSFPTLWHDGLSDDDRPETDYGTVALYADMTAAQLDETAPLPEDSQSDTLGAGIILPTERPDPDDRITLIDWDDVRDPVTGEIIEECAAALEQSDTYAELSTSGGGIHQLVLGELPERGKFIAELRENPVFDHDSPPQVEIYDGGRHVACTRQHVEGTGDDIVADQQLIDGLLEEYGSDEGANSVFGDYDIGDPPDDKPICYHAALQARVDPPDNTAAFDVNTYAAMLGLAAGYDIEDVLADFKDYEPDYGFDKRTTEEHLEKLQPKIEAGSSDEKSTRGLLPPTASTLWQAGILPVSVCPEADCPIPTHGGDTATATDDSKREWSEKTATRAGFDRLSQGRNHG